MAEPIARAILQTPVESELQESFLAYSLSVIHSRAIPDVRDGLKPVQRRILYGMWRQRLRPDAPFRKSARVVGDVMGRYHPHGDSAIYDALVRLGQDFSLRVPLVEPHGNFGSLDDPPAASRYTECRLAPAAEALLAGLDEDTVEFRPNYDGEDTEPVYLPAGFPNLVVNGTAGIAVGMTTSIPPHNLGEVATAVQLLLDDPEIGDEALLAVLPGPDFPGGGEIVGAAGIAEAYATGRGSLRLRARAEVSHDGRRPSLVFSELPYLVGPERVLARIGELARAGRLDAVADVRDLSDRSGLRIVVDLKAGSDPRRELARLCKLTPLEETVTINAIVLADGEPRCLGIRELLTRFVDHRVDVVVRRSRHRLERARARAHLVEGLLAALDAIDAVVTTIRAAADTADARRKLRRKFKLSEAQADHILEMQLRRLTRLEAGRLADELAELNARIGELEALLADGDRQRAVVGEELAAVAAAHATPRRTLISPEDALAGAAEAPAVVDAPAELTLSDTGIVARTPADGWKGRLGADDLLVTRVETRTGAHAHVVDAEGVAGPLHVGSVPEAGASRGVDAAMAAGVAGPVVGLVALADGVDLVVVTAAGTLKRVRGRDVAGLRRPAGIISLADGDRVVAVHPVTDASGLVLVTTDGQLLRTPAGALRAQARGAAGVVGIRLRPGAAVLGAWLAGTDDVVVVASDAGRAKLTPASEFPTKGRGTGGVRCIALNGDARVSAAWCGPRQALAARTSRGVTRARPPEGRRDGVGGEVPAVWFGIGVAR